MGTVGENIKRRREELGITQEELAKKMNYKSKSTINKIEMNINDITQSKVVAFAKALETTTSFIMGWEENLKSENEDIIVDIMSDNRLLAYVKKIKTLSDSKKEKLYGYIDCLSEMED